MDGFLLRGQREPRSDWPGGDFAGNAIGWELATDIWEELDLGDVGLRGRALPAACLTLLYRASLRGSTFSPADLALLVGEDAELWEELLAGEEESTMLFMFGDVGSFRQLSPKTRADLLGPFIRQLRR